MAGDPRVRELLEELLESGHTPEHVCRHSPELLPQVLKRWHRLNACDAQLDALFPPAGFTSPLGSPCSHEPGADLPQIPGYEVQELLGRGGMGVVFRARHLRLNRIVALKMALAGAYSGSHERERFHREAMAVAGLRHPNVVQIHDVGDSDGRPYYTMEFLEGGSLAERLLGTPMPAREAALLVATLARAVEAAHKGGIIHRDLKPSNVLLTADGTPKLADFGLARRQEGGATLTISGARVGTPSYMAPEQARGLSHALGPGLDIYALGAILYELLTGRPPFRAETAAETERQVIEQEPASPSRLNARAPRDLETICLKCLQKEPRGRYATASALAEDLSRFLNHEPIRARAAGRFVWLARWAKRNPVLVASLSTVLVTGLMAIAMILWQWRDAVEARQEAELAVMSERWERYRSNISAAASALQIQNNSGTARRALEAAPEEHRNWEWRHLKSQLDNSRTVMPGTPSASLLRQPIISPSGDQVAVVDKDARLINLWDTATGKVSGALLGHVGAVGVLAYSPDGKRLASGSADKTIRLWDPATLKQVAVLRGHENSVDWLYYSPDGLRICSGGDGPARLWDATTGQLVAALGGPVRRSAVVFTPDSRRLVIGVDREARVYDALLGRQITALGTHQAQVVHLVNSPDGKRIASSDHDDKNIRLWDGLTGQEVAVLRGHAFCPEVLAFSPDGARLASGGTYPDVTIRLWESATGRQIAIVTGHENTIRTIAFDADGRRAVSASADQAWLWDGVTGERLAQLRDYSGDLWKAIFSSDGKRVVTASADQTLRAWDSAAGQLVAVLRGHTAEVHAAAFAAHGSLLVSVSSDGEARAWDMNLAERNGSLRGHEGFVYDVAFSLDGTQVASAAWDGTARVWEVATGRQSAVLEHEKGTRDDKIVGSVAWHPGGKQLATATRADTITVWDLGTGKPRHIFRAPTGEWTGEIRTVFNPAGTLLASGSRDGSIRLWDVATGKPAGVLRGHEAPVLDVAFNPGGNQLASVGYDRTVRLWDVATRSAVTILPAEAEGFRIAYSADGRLVAAGSRGGNVRVWNAHSHQELHLLPHGNRVYGLALSPDGTRLATGCGDNTIRIWDIATGQDVCELRGHRAYVHAVAFSPDGTRLASASGDLTVRIWDTFQASSRARPPAALFLPRE
ncbi:MAG TPA: protein kinase [Pirellulales bacterium]|nr:protein kinase [Pirellulales bacterium]